MSTLVLNSSNTTFAPTKVSTKRRTKNNNKNSQQQQQQNTCNKPTAVSSLPFVVSSQLIDVGYQGVKTVEPARPTSKTFNLVKAFSDLSRETQLNRTLRHQWNISLNPASRVQEKKNVTEYMAGIQEFASVRSIPEFCEAWNRCYLANKPYSKIIVFKKGIKPCWEDPDNKRGGRFVIRGATMEETLSMYITIVARLMTGRLQSDYNDICGAVLQVKGSDQLWIQIWNKDATDADQINRVKIFLNRLTTRTVAYQVHDLSAKMAKTRLQKVTVDSTSQDPNTSSVSQEVVDDFVKDFLAAI